MCVTIIEKPKHVKQNSSLAGVIHEKVTVQKSAGRDNPCDKGGGKKVLAGDSG